MPQLIKHIDFIARKLQRDVLFVAFHPVAKGPSSSESDIFNFFDWKKSKIRGALISWLDDHQIEWSPCGDIALTNMSYRGHIYLDVPYDTNLPIYKVLIEYLEFPDGTMRFPDATLCVLSLEIAMKNAAHDEPGYWERWAEGQ